MTADARKEELKILNHALLLLTRNILVYGCELGVFLALNNHDRELLKRRKEVTAPLTELVDAFVDAVTRHHTQPRMGNYADSYVEHTYRTESSILPILLAELVEIRRALIRLRNQAQTGDLIYEQEVLTLLERALSWTADALTSFNESAEGICEPVPIEDIDSSLDGLIKVGQQS